MKKVTFFLVCRVLGCAFVALSCGCAPQQTPQTPTTPVRLKELSVPTAAPQPVATVSMQELKKALLPTKKVKSSPTAKPTETPFVQKSSQVSRLTGEPGDSVEEAMVLCGSKFQENLEVVADETLSLVEGFKAQKIRFRIVDVLNDLGNGVHGDAPIGSFREALLDYATSREAKQGHRAAIKSALNRFAQSQSE